MTTPLLQVRSANCRINSRLTLHIADLTIDAGQHWCFFGGNGAGKSLLAQLLCGRLLAGHQHVQHADDFSPERDILVVSFEEQQALWNLDCRHDISEYTADALDQGTTVADLVLGGANPEPGYHELLKQLGLEDLQQRGIRYLSSGQVRKALLARALFRRPRLLILDDPLESVDRDSQQGLAAVIAGWMTPDTATVLLCRRERDILPGITHLALLENLQIVAQGTLSAVRSGPHWQRIARRAVTLPQVLPAPAVGHRLPALLPGLPLIELRGVNAGYGDNPVLRNFSWVMGVDQHTLIEGPNGCGKSTLLSLLNGENHKAYGQQVILFGRLRGTGETVWEVKARFGTVSNELHNRYVKGWKVLDVVVSGFFASVGLYDDSGTSEHRAARAWLRTLGIEALAAHFYQELSFGQQRLVLLARAMVKHPTVLILDEPCVGLDDYHRALLLGTVDLIATATGTHIVYVSHTRGERPRCINQHIMFSGPGHYRIADRILADQEDDWAPQSAIYTK